jgi:hypothetical protein
MDKKAIDSEQVGLGRSDSFGLIARTREKNMVMMMLLVPCFTIENRVREKRGGCQLLPLMFSTCFMNSRTISLYFS